MSPRALIWLASLLTLAALPAAAMKNDEMTIGGAKLGMSTAEVRKVFPKMEPTTENLGAQPFDSEFLTRYVVKNVHVPELGGQSSVVELRFWKDKLWAFIVYYPDSDDKKVIESLTKRMGPPNGTNPSKPGWQGDKSLTFVETEHHWYSVTDNELSKQAQTWFYAQIEKMKQLPPGAAPVQGQPAAAPAATPAAAAPAAPAATPAAK